MAGEVVTLDRNAIRMLRFIRKSDVCAEGYCRYEDFYPAFEAETGWKEQRGYISYCEDAEGNHAAYFTWVNIRGFLVRSILVPIAVSAATAYITVLISALMDSAA